MQEGEPVVLSSVKLPKGEYIQLQPQSALWVDIPLNVREAMYVFRCVVYARVEHSSSRLISISLADQLRNYQTLTVGDTVTLAYGGTKYTFFVIAVKPSATTDNPSEEPNRGKPNLSAGKAVSMDGVLMLLHPYHAFSSSGVSIVDADIAVDVIEPREPYRAIIPIELDASSPTVGDLSLNDSTTYRLRIDGSLHDGLTIAVELLTHSLPM